MSADPAVAVPRLCKQAMSAEARGDRDEAYALYLRAWTERVNGYEGCIAAHYIAKFQHDPLEAHRWNKAALDAALQADDERLKPFFASLYLNLGKSCEDLHRIDDARRYYVLASAAASCLHDDGLANLIRQGIERGKARVGA